MTRRTKIIVTLGPASHDDLTIERLLEAGADVVRLNLSHGSRSEHQDLIAKVRKIAASMRRQVPIMLDLMGPRYRLGHLADGPRRLRTDQEVVLGSGSDADVPIDNPDLLRHLRPRERVLIDNGLVELEVEACESDRVRATVIAGGTISDRKGINLPDSNLPFEISDKDLDDIRFAVREQVAYLAASYVGRSVDIESIRERTLDFGRPLPIIAKLERARAVDHIEEIVATADGVMVARGDLGVEVPLHRVPTLQGQILDACRRFGKPAVVATQMLESMIENPRPTRAEVSDVANSVFEGADALLLTGETAAGKHPVEVVRIMTRIIEEAETPAARDDTEIRARLLLESPGDGFPPVADAVARAAVFTTYHLSVRCIVVLSRSGFSARLISRYRPQVPVLVLTPDDRVARLIQILWGVRPLRLSARLDHDEEILPALETHLKAENLVKSGDRLVILRSGPDAEGRENLMRVHEVTG